MWSVWIGSNECSSLVCWSQSIVNDWLGWPLRLEPVHKQAWPTFMQSVLYSPAGLLQEPPVSIAKPCTQHTAGRCYNYLPSWFICLLTVAWSVSEQLARTCQQSLPFDFDSHHMKSAGYVYTLESICHAETQPSENHTKIMHALPVHLCNPLMKWLKVKFIIVKIMFISHSYYILSAVNCYRNSQLIVCNNYNSAPSV